MEKRKIQNSVYVLETKPNPALPLGLALCFPKGGCVCEELLSQAGLRGRKSRERRTEGSAAVAGSSEPLLGAAVTLETTQWMGRLGRLERRWAALSTVCGASVGPQSVRPRGLCCAEYRRGGVPWLGRGGRARCGGASPRPES